ncbi:ATP-binding protein [Streptantibioticus ferralitis]|uniref:ATP-binding protein n=1 Tax=Streptantibioticus ferralitis TaxID=236510 RepID=A0ABT5YW38_9ACTN|nr:ATP-binding protein [Streptantibioticus ferralitis]MDF2255708.1 ATP-binding protein [Streptantibioticus ferralitis]
MTTHPADSAGNAVPDGSGRHWLALAARGAFPLDDSAQGPSGFAACGLAGDLQAAGAARQFTRSTLTGWGMPALVDNAAIIVSELLSNAMRYGLATAQELPAPAHPVWLGLLLRGTTVLCAVCDPGTGVPVLKEPDHLAETGRGLHVIDALSESWGWTPPDHGGKVVWAAVSACA